ncbi:hypothetical protein GW17_00048717 [Ensete ventricosum]|nr:hypothetical protein GW17_00048717 [Ensete ventricosum]
MSLARESVYFCLLWTAQADCSDSALRGVALYDLERHDYGHASFRDRYVASRWLSIVAMGAIPKYSLSTPASQAELRIVIHPDELPLRTEKITDELAHTGLNQQVLAQQTRRLNASTRQAPGSPLTMQTNHAQED